MPPADKAAIALVIGYDRRHGEAEGTPVALRHAHAPARRSADEVDLDALVPARHDRRHPLPRKRVPLEDQRGVRDLRREGVARDDPWPHRPPDQLPDRRQLPRLQEDRQHARRRLGRHRPPLLQQQRRRQPRVRLREDQPPARLPAADGWLGARLRPLPAHRLGLPPRRAPAAVRDRDEGAVQEQLLGHEGPEARRRGDEERRGRGRRRQGAVTAHDPPLRPVRVRPSARPLLPGEDRRPHGLLGADDGQHKRPERRRGLLEPRRRGACSGDRRRAQPQAEDEGAEAVGDVGDGAERERRARARAARRRISSVSAATTWSSRRTARRATRRRSTTSTRRSTTTPSERARPQRRGSWRSCSAPPRRSRMRSRGSASARPSVSRRAASCGRSPTTRCSQSSPGRRSTTPCRRRPRARR